MIEERFLDARHGEAREVLDVFDHRGSLAANGLAFRGNVPDSVVAITETAQVIRLRYPTHSVA
jgi:hypothetical protein